MTHLPSAAAIALATVLSLSACAAQPEPAVTVTVTAEARPPSATPTPAATVTPTPTPSADVVAAPDPTLTPNAPAPPPTPRPWGPAFDNGPIPGARGVPVTDDQGNPIRYTVIEGDSFFDIAQRFDLPQQQLLSINPQVPGIGQDIYIGDVINLDWTKKGL